MKGISLLLLASMGATELAPIGDSPLIKMDLRQVMLFSIQDLPHKPFISYGIQKYSVYNKGGSVPAQGCRHFPAGGFHPVCSKVSQNCPLPKVQAYDHHDGKQEIIKVESFPLNHYTLSRHSCQTVLL